LGRMHVYLRMLSSNRLAILLAINETAVAGQGPGLAR